HSCGPDAHMTIVLGVMKSLKQVESELTGAIRAIFKPAEELGNGAEEVMKERVIDHSDYIYGVRVRAHNEITYTNCAPSIEHGSSTFMRGKIHGKDHHGARPNEGVNTIEVGSTIIQQLQQIHTLPYIPASVKMTNFHAGTDNLNVI